MKASGLFVAILVLVAIVVLPVHLALAQAPPPNPTRALPDKVERGATFNVTVNFTSPADNFNGINVRDTAPVGWIVNVSTVWCYPYADGAKVDGGNQAQIVWIGPYNNGTNFTALYKVTVPCGASPGIYSFSVNYPAETMFRWHVENSVYLANISDGHSEDYVLEVIGPTINFAPTSIDFYGAVNGTNPQNQSLELWSSTPCLLNWTLSDDAAWLSESPTNGSCTKTHSSATLSVNSSGMPEGEYLANITINASEANNPQEIVPVTLHMRTTSILEAHVAFPMARVGSLVEPFEVKLFNPGTSNVVWEGVRTTNNTGWFNITDVVVGTYDMAIKNCTCLSELVSNVTVIGGVGAVVNFIIREGDIDDSDYVDMGDYSALSTAFNTLPSDPKWNANADLDRSGYIDMGDYSLFSTYFNQIGHAYGRF
jgi:hypothetical protein